MTTETLVTTQDPERINDTRKAELLSSPVEHIDITKFDARPIVDAMGKMSFTSRDLARATGIYNQMLEDPDCSIILVVAGSTSAGGCMNLYAELVKSNMVDAIVATGATIVDMDFFEALGHKHFQANEIPDDDTLRSLYIDRIYDTYIDEQQLQDCVFTIGQIADRLEPPSARVRAWLENDCSHEASARALGVHRHTVRTRLAQAERVLGRDLSSFPTRAELWAALRALD